MQYSSENAKVHGKMFSSDAPIMSDIRDYKRTNAKMHLRGVVTHTKENIETVLSADYDQYIDAVY